MARRKTKKNNIILPMIILGIQIILFVCFVTGGMFGEWIHGKMFLVVLALFGAAGIALLIALRHKKMEKWLKRFLLLAGISTAGFFAFVILHNMFYAFTELTKEMIILPYIFEAMHVVFFLIAVIACPLGILTGFIGSIVQFIRILSR